MKEDLLKRRSDNEDSTEEEFFQDIESIGLDEE